MFVRLLLNIYSTHTVQGLIKSVYTPRSFNYLWHSTFPVQRCNNDLIESKPNVLQLTLTQLFISQWYSEEVRRHHVEKLR